MKKMSFTKKQFLNTYGNDFSKGDLIMTGLVMIMAIALTCYLHKLNVMYSIVIIGSGILCIPIIITSYFKYKFEKKRFEDYCLYFENMKMYFKVYHKINKSLEMTLKTIDVKSPMHKLINKAIKEINVSGDYEKALGYIDDKYHNTYLARLHSLLITGEEQGSESIYTNLDSINYQEWKEDMKVFQKRKKSSKLVFYIIALICLAISVCMILMLNEDTMAKMLIESSLYQFYTFVELELLLFSFMYVYCTLVNKKWLRGDE